MAETPLFKKLRIKEDDNIVVINAPNLYGGFLNPLPERVFVNHFPNVEGLYDVVHLFVSNKASLDELIEMGLGLMKRDGVLWISYPKKTSKIQTDLSRDKGWDSLMKLPLQRLSLISFNEQWSAFAMKHDNGKIKSVKKMQSGVDVNGVNYIDTAKRIITVPDDLQLAFKKNKIAQAFYSTLSFSNQKEYVCWIVDAKQVATREKRVQSTIEKLEKKLKNPAAK